MRFLQAISLGVPILATLVFSGCGGKNSEKLVGKWSLDTDATIKKMDEAAESKTDEEKAAMEFAKGMMGMMKMEFEFTADEKMNLTVSAMGKEETKEGTYKIKTEDPLVISGTMDGKTEDIPIKFIDGDTIEFTMPDGGGEGVMVLERVK